MDTSEIAFLVYESRHQIEAGVLKNRRQELVLAAAQLQNQSSPVMEKAGSSP